MTIIKRERVQDSYASEAPPSDHVVQFYETDEFLLDSLTGFASAGLATRDACIVLATEAHRIALEGTRSYPAYLDSDTLRPPGSGTGSLSCRRGRLARQAVRA